MKEVKEKENLNKLLNLFLFSGLLSWCFTILIVTAIFLVTLYANPFVINSAIVFCGILISGHLIFFLKKR